MIPKKDKMGFVSVSLTSTEEKKLRAAWSVLDQLAFHLYRACRSAYHGVPGDTIRDASDTVARLIDESPSMKSE